MAPSRQYKIRLASGRVLGPLDRDRIRKLIRKRHLTGAEVGREYPDGDWRRSGSSPRSRISSFRSRSRMGRRFRRSPSRSRRRRSCFLRKETSRRRKSFRRRPGLPRRRLMRSRHLTRRTPRPKCFPARGRFTRSRSLRKRGRKKTPPGVGTRRPSSRPRPGRRGNEAGPRREKSPGRGPRACKRSTHDGA